MKFRTKLILTFGMLWIIFAITGRALFIVEVRKLLFNELRVKAKALAATTAASISGDQLARLKSPDQPEFKSLTQFLLNSRAANQRPDIDLKYIYFIHPDPINPNKIEITIDVEDPPNESTYYFRNEFLPREQLPLLKHIHEDWATQHVYKDRWGSWLTGIAPIYDSKQNYVASLAIDLSAKSIEDEINHMIILAIISGGTFLLIGLIAVYFVSIYVTRDFDQIIKAVGEIGHGNLNVKVNVSSHDEFGKLAQSIADMERGLEENQRLKLNFVRYVSKHIMEQILSSQTPIELKGERRKITVLFSDIRQFTTLAEKLPPEEVVSLLNEYLDRMLRVIFDNGGTLDKFLGDGIMVEFGAPLEDSEQEKHAVKTAIEMQRALEDLNLKWKDQRGVQLKIGIGIHTGQAVVGNMGSEKRMDYTAVGDTVNIASMLEQENKKQKTKILISNTTAAGLGGQYKVKSLGAIIGALVRRILYIDGDFDFVGIDWIGVYEIDVF